MQEYKEGDRVKSIEDAVWFSKGDIGIVESVWDDGTLMVDFGGQGNAKVVKDGKWAVRKDNIELLVIKPTRCGALDSMFKSLDIVSHTTEDGERHVGMVATASLTEEDEGVYRAKYSVKWLVGGEDLYSAWWDHKDLDRHCNIMVKVSEAMSYMTNKAHEVKEQFNHMSEEV